MPYPRILQRLFANEGAGPKLRGDIIPYGSTADTAAQGNDARLVALEAWRQAMIGTPMPMAGTTLPSGFMWADGSFASFASYPELKAKYDAGGFAGILLAYNASEQDIAAYPGKFKPDAANPTGLFVPRLNGLFTRYCGSEGTGAYHRDEIRNIWGAFSSSDPGNDSSSPIGAFLKTGYALIDYAGGQLPLADTWIEFNASRIVPTGPENVPPHYRQPIALYLGRVAEI